jgi:CHAD domain-containing protein
MEHGSILKSYLIGQLMAAKEQLDAIGPGADIEVLHAFRVALRRFRSVLTAYGKRDHAMDAVVKSMIKRTNPLRETDVFFASVDPSDNPKLFAALTSYRERQYKNVWKADTAKRFAKALERLIADLSELELDTGKKKLVRKGKHLYAAAKKEHKALTKDSKEALIHEVRLRYKKARYVLEFLDGAGLIKAGKKIKNAKKAQEHFGAIQDAVNQLEWLHRFCSEHPSDECSALYAHRKKALKQLKKSFKL